jgi:hypothetical protein
MKASGRIQRILGNTLVVLSFVYLVAIQVLRYNAMVDYYPEGTINYWLVRLSWMEFAFLWGGGFFLLLVIGAFLIVRSSS